jgi:hypothetical protein
MILRELREIDQATDDILVYGFDGTTNKKIKTNTDGKVDIVSDNLDITLSTLKAVLDLIDSNTDTLEDKTQSIRDQLDVLSSSRASESTSQSILNALGEASGTDLLNELQNIFGKLSDINNIDFATEATLLEVRNLLSSIETKLQTIIDKLDVNLSTRASESTVAEIRDTIGQESGSTVLSRLQDIWNKLTELFNNGVAKVRIWNGTYEADITNENKLKVDTEIGKPGLAGSSFGLLKVAPEAILANLRWTENLINNGFAEDLISSGSSGNWSIVESSALQLNTGASPISGIELESIKRYYYQSGRGQLFKISIILGDSGIEGNIREWGLGDSTNGVFIRLNGTAYEFVLRSGGAETVVPASNWDTPVTPDPNGHTWYIQFQWLGVGNFFVYYDGDLIYTHNFQGTSTSISMEIPDLPVRLRNYNDSNTSDVFLKSGCASVVSEGANIISGLDDNDILREARFTASGRLKIDTSPPDAPIDTTAVTITEYDNVSGSDDNVYVIPSGETLVIQRFSAGAEVDSTAGNVIELWFDVNGDGSVLEIIDTIFASGTSDQHDLRSEFAGDGIAAIRMRRQRFSGGSKQIFGRWEGYLE